MGDVARSAYQRPCTFYAAVCQAVKRSAIARLCHLLFNGLGVQGRDV